MGFLPKKVDDEDNQQHYQQFQNLPFVQREAKKARVEGSDADGDARQRLLDDAAASILLGLATSSAVPASAAGRAQVKGVTVIGGKVNGKVSGKSVIGRKDRKKKVDPSSLKSVVTGIPFADPASISSIKLNGVVQSGSILGSGSGSLAGVGTSITVVGCKRGQESIQTGTATGTKERRAVEAAKDAATGAPLDEPLELLDLPAPSEDVVRVSVVPQRWQSGNWPQLQNSVVVVGKSFEPSGSLRSALTQTFGRTEGATGRTEEGERQAQPQGGPSLAQTQTQTQTQTQKTQAPAGKQARGRQPSFDELTLWCVRVKRAAMAKGSEYRVGIGDVVAVANGLSEPHEPKINGSTLRKRLKKLSGLTWVQIGTNADENPNDLGAEDPSVEKAVQLLRNGGGESGATGLDNKAV